MKAGGSWMERPTKYAFYDFSVAPYSFDFVSFLICARSNGCTQVVFVPGKRYGVDERGNRFEYQKCTVEEQERRLKNMLLPLCSHPIVCTTREEAKALWHEGCFPPDYTVENPTFSHMTAHVLCQKTIWNLGAPSAIVKEVRRDVGPDPIVIPMRECDYRQLRNSNEPAWIKVAEWLIAKGENVWFIPDTAKADKVYPVGKTYKKAALSVLHRLALTQIAKLTIGANSGSMVFAFYFRHPMLYFNPIVEGSNEASAEFWGRNYVPVGSQLPWFTNLQRIVWGCQDDYESIIKNLETWYSVKEGIAEWPPFLLPRFPMAGVVSNDQRSEHIRIAMATGHPTLKSLKTFHDIKRLSIACFGPSLKDTYQELKHPIMAVSGAHDFLISKGIIPDYYVACDPREEQTAFIQNPHKDVHYLMASCMHPKVWDLLKGHRVTLWHLLNGHDGKASIRKHDPTGELVGGGTTVGLRAIEVACFLGFRKFAIHGMDSSWKDGERHSGAHPGKKQNPIKVHYKTNPKEFITSPQMREAAEEFMNTYVAWRPVFQNGKRLDGFKERPDLDIQMFGDGLLQTMFHESQKEMVTA